MTEHCPTCEGVRVPHHPNGFGWLHATICTLRDADDATIANDNLNAWWQPTTRATTPTERALLEACGITLPSDIIDPDTGDIIQTGALTDVTLITNGVVHRGFRYRTPDGWSSIELDPDDLGGAA